MLTIQRKISPYNHYKGGNTKKYIVLHDVGALGQAKANVDYFAKQNRGASAHYFVDPSSIWQSVEDDDRAWHVGDDKPNDSHDVGDLINNHNTIGVEMCLNANWKIEADTKKNTVDLVHYLQEKYNIPDNNIVRHYDASGKNCPGSLSGNDWTDWKAFYKQITASEPVESTVKPNTPDTHTVAKNDTLWGISKQYNVTVAELKQWNNLQSDVIQIGQVLKMKKDASQSSVSTSTTTKTSTTTITTKASLTIDGRWGAETTKALQRYFGTTIDGVISGQPSNASTKNIPSAKIGSGSSQLIRAMQKWVGTTQDGTISNPSQMIRAIQKRFGTTQDGKVSHISLMVKEMQRRLNAGKL